MSVGRRPPSDQHNTTYDRLLAHVQAQRRLFSVHWELTYRCNERCAHCYLNVLPPGAPAPGELTTAECLRVVDQLADLGAFNLALSGGEILVRRDLFEIAEYAHSKRFLLRLFTNGTLIKPANADRIAALHPFAVEVSVYGADAATHDAITQCPGSFAATLRGLHLLAARGVRTVWKTPLMRANVRQFHAIQALATGVGAQFRYDLTITPKITGDSAPLRHRLTNEDLVWLFRQILEPDGGVPHLTPPDCTTCNIGASALVIDPYGDVFPCMETRLCAGNVRHTSLAALWEESPVWPEVRQLTVNDLPVCRTCTLRPFCTRCHGHALNEHGDLRAPAAVNCQQALARRQVLLEKGMALSET